MADLSKNYTEAGVNIDAATKAVDGIKENVKSTFSENVITGLGTFGAMYNLKEIVQNYEEPILTQSIDGIGTKVKIAGMMNKYDTLGMDIVNHCSNDILAQGAKPLTFLDYIAVEKMTPQINIDIVNGIIKACRNNNISLIGGEMAEMPGVYEKNELDIAGCITGIVDRKKVITGKDIKCDDIILGFASNGLHTNGYSLARKLFFETGGYTVDSQIPELEKTVGETLLAPHTNYTNPILELLEAGVKIKGIAHITGGGFIDNIPRILPKNYIAEIKKDSWPVLPIFKVMQKLGNLEEIEMYRIFNMGIGLVIAVSPEESNNTKEIINNQYPEFKLYEIGKVVEAERKVKIV